MKLSALLLVTIGVFGCSSSDVGNGQANMDEDAPYSWCDQSFVDASRTSDLGGNCFSVASNRSTAPECCSEAKECIFYDGTGNRFDRTRCVEDSHDGACLDTQLTTTTTLRPNTDLSAQDEARLLLTVRGTNATIATVEGAFAAVGTGVVLRTRFTADNTWFVAFEVENNGASYGAIFPDGPSNVVVGRISGNVVSECKAFESGGYEPGVFTSDR